MAGGFAAARIPLAGGDWASLTTNLLLVSSGAAASAQAAAPPKLEVSYRDPFTSHARLVAGTFSRRAAPAGTLAVAASTQVAARFGLHPGSRLTLVIPSSTAALYVTAIVQQNGAGSTFWTQDATVAAPSLVVPPHSGLPYWVAGVIADPGQLAAMQDTFGGPGLELAWEYPLAVGGVNADQAQGLYDAVNHVTTITPTLGGALAAGADSLTVDSPLLQQLSGFLGTQAAIATVLLLLFVSLVVVGAAVIVLAARMVVARRDVELTMLRARGGSLRQVAALMLRAAVIAAGPGMLIGAGLAVAVIPGAAVSSLPGWPLAGIAAVAALASPPLIAVWRYRRPAPASNPARITTAETGRRRVAWRRPVAEITAIAASVTGLIVLHDQGVPGRRRDRPVPHRGAGARGRPDRPHHLAAVPGGRPRPARGVGARRRRHRLRRAVPGRQVLADRGAARVRTGARAQPGHLRRNGQPGRQPRRGRGLLAEHRSGRDDPGQPLFSPGQHRRGERHRLGPRGAPGHRASGTRAG